MKLKSGLFKDLFGVAFLQILQILLSAVVGFLLIRMLSKNDYAIFSLFTNTMATVIGIAAMAITVLFIPFANKFGLESVKLSNSTIIYRILNKPMLYIGLAIGLISCFISAINNKWVDINFIIASLLILISIRNQYINRFYESYFKLSGEPLKPFMANFIAEFIRLILISILYFVFKAHTSITIVILFVFLSISTSISNYLLKCKAEFNISENRIYTVDERNIFWGNFKPLLFPSFFFQIMQLFRNSLIYFITGSGVIAEAAALGRLMMLFAAMDKVVEMVIIPRLGRQKKRIVFLRNLLLSLLVIVVVGICLVISAYYYPQLWLWLLGEKYSNIKAALLWAIGTAVIERISGLIMFAQLSKGRTRGQWWIPIFSTSIYYLFFYINGVRTSEDATKGLMIAATVNLFAQCLMFILIYKKEDEL
ncbi:hypothetical protein ACFOW1_14835 [Parasediminibacterium paludis]|uniref:O-antigen/teichoic acid export membrane protein n=1 Tax=Parasediminibacterium paludis TaxID=908966 RepID=A0ABV8Q1I6_9BACT